MKWAVACLGLLTLVASSGCWRPYYGTRFAQPAYPQGQTYAPPYVQQPPVQSQPAPIVQQPVIQQAPMVQQAPMAQGCQPVYCQPCPTYCTPCY